MKTINSRYKAMIKSLLALTIWFAFGPVQAQPEKQVVSDTVEISVGNKTLSIITDSTQKGKDVRFTTSKKENSEFEMNDDDDDDGGGDGDGDGDDDDEKKKKKPVDLDFLSIDLGAQFMTYDRNFNIPVEYNALDIKPLNSTSLSLHLAKSKFRMAKGHVNLVTAITMENNRYSFREPITLVPSQDSLTILTDTIGYRKHKLIVWYAQIPLLLKFETNPDHKDKNFHFAVGGYAGLLLGAHTKKKLNNGDKTTVYDDYNLETFRYGAMARIGFRGLELYAKYDLTPLFRENQGPTLHPITFGISLTGPM